MQQDKQIKECVQCNEKKLVDEFRAGRKKCKKCEAENQRARYQENPEKYRGIAYQSRDKYPEKAKEAQRKYQENNKEKRSAACAKWRMDHPDKQAEAKKRWRNNNKDRELETLKKWKKNNPEKVREYRKISLKRAKASPKGALNFRMSHGIRDSLRRGKEGYHWESLVGYTVEDLKRSIEKKFKDGMTWEKLLKGEIHIDHKIPIAAFNYSSYDDIDFQKCWALKNLQPMWASENMSKQDKIDKPFQPSFVGV